MVKILQGSVVTQTMLGGLTIYPPIANFLQCISAKFFYENWLTADKVIAKISRLSRLSFLAHPVIIITRSSATAEKQRVSCAYMRS